MNEIRFKIGGDKSSLSRVFVETKTEAAKTGAEAGRAFANGVSRGAGAMESVGRAAAKSFGRQFDLKNVFNRTVIALGLSIDKIAEKVGEAFSGGSLASWENALSAAQRTAAAIEENTLSRFNTLQKIAALEAKIEQNRSNENPTPRDGGTLTGWRRAFDSPGGRQIMAAIGFSGFGETEADAKTRSQTALGDRNLDERQLRDLRAKESRDRERISEARREFDNLGLEGQNKFNVALAEANRAGEKLLEARRRSAETTELELDFITKLKAAKQVILDIAREQSREERERLEDERRRAEDAVRLAEGNMETAERIREIETDAAAIGETKGEHIIRLRREAHELDRKAADINRTEDDRNRLRVQAAEKRAEAAREEYNWRSKTANIKDSEQTPSGRKNTTTQGILANKAAKAKAAAHKARSEGRFDEARKQGDIARGLEEQFETNDRAGMIGEMGPLPAGGWRGAYPIPSEWDLKYGPEMQAREDRLNAPRQPHLGTAHDDAYNARFAPGGGSWDERYGPQLKARNDALNASRAPHLGTAHDDAYNERFKPRMLPNRTQQLAPASPGKPADTNQSPEAKALEEAKNYLKSIDQKLTSKNVK